MARTRTQDYGASDKDSRMSMSKGAKDPTAKAKKTTSKSKNGTLKRDRDTVESEAEDHPEDANKDAKGSKPKKAKHTNEDATKETAATEGVDSKQLQDMIAKYGALPLSDSGLPSPAEATPETILALVLNAMLTSARISHELAYKSVKCLIEAGYHDVNTLKKSSWEERTEVLTKGGYTRYREKTATALGELADFILDEYEGDLNNIVKRADSSPAKVREMIKGIKGIGNVGTDIFFDTAQGVWPSLAPFIDQRSLKTAEQCGLGVDVDHLWQILGKDPKEMCKLSAALTTVRLEKKEHEFK